MPEFHVRSKKLDGEIEVESVVNPVNAKSEDEAIKEIKKLDEYADYDSHVIELVVK